MSSIPSEIIRGKAFNIGENSSSPLSVFRANVGSLERLALLASDEDPIKVCFLGSSCMYPDKDGALREEMLGTGPVYAGNALYSYIKLLGWQICKVAKSQFFVAIPSDIFGDPKDSHFIPQIMSKLHIAKLANDSKVTFWGTGAAIRHPIFEEDLERILKQLMERYQGSDPINIAPPVSYAKSVSSIVRDIQEVVGYHGDIEWDAKYSDGQKVKILDNSKLSDLGLSEFTPWKESLEKMYLHYENKNNL